jgi:hypothetical protein
MCSLPTGSAFYRGGSQGTGFSKLIVEKPAAVKPPARKPDFELEEKTSPAQVRVVRHQIWRSR